MSSWKKQAKFLDGKEVVYFSNFPEFPKTQEVHIWDLDKTYLDTKFESFFGMIKAFFESPSEKTNVAGTRVLVEQLHKSWKEPEPYSIFFITGSPPQMYKNIIEKLRADGVFPRGVFMRDNIMNISPKLLGHLKRHTGYKLLSLLMLRKNLNEDVCQILWGDDYEGDILTYCIYSDICSRRLQGQSLEKVLSFLKLKSEQIKAILKLQEAIPAQDPVKRVYLNLALDTDTEYYLKYGKRVLPVYNTFQMALDLFQSQRISKSGVLKVGQVLIKKFGFSQEQLSWSLDDLIRRQVFGQIFYDKIHQDFRKEKIIVEDFEPSVPPPSLVSIENGFFATQDDTEPWTPKSIDYFHDYR